MRLMMYSFYNSIRRTSEQRCKIPYAVICVWDFYVLNDINYSYIYIQKHEKNEHIAHIALK